MKRAERLLEVWSWLPTFRAVAELEHVSNAARSLGVTPAAVSKTVSRLEARLGVRLFERLHREMRLLPPGQKLLNTVRTAMRSIDEALPVPTAEQHGPELVRVGFVDAPVGFLLHEALPAFRGLSLSLEFEPVARDRVGTLLLAGDLDVVFTAGEVGDQRLVCRRVGPLACVRAWQPFNRKQNAPVRFSPAVAAVSKSLLSHGPLVVPASVSLPVGTQREPVGPLLIHRVSRTRARPSVRRVDAIVRAACEAGI